MTDDEKKLKGIDFGDMVVGDHVDEVIEMIQKAVGEGNVHVIKTQQDIDELTVEMELRDFIKGGGKLN